MLFSTNRRLQDTEIKLGQRKIEQDSVKAIRVRQKLADIGIDISRVLVNKAKNDELIETIKNQFKGYPISRFPLGSRELYGLEILKTYVMENLVGQCLFSCPKDSAKIDLRPAL